MMHCILSPAIQTPLFTHQNSQSSINECSEDPSNYTAKINITNLSNDKTSGIEYESSHKKTSQGLNLPVMNPPTSDSITTHFIDSVDSPVANSILSFPYQHYRSVLTPVFLKFTKENYIQPIYDTQSNHIILPIECGQNQAFLYLTKLCQGSKGPCILFKTHYWLTPNEFQYISGRETAKDWKRSIRHNGKSIKLLINKGIIIVHSPLCECSNSGKLPSSNANLPYGHSDKFGYVSSVSSAPSSPLSYLTEPTKNATLMSPSTHNQELDSATGINFKDSPLLGNSSPSSNHRSSRSQSISPGCNSTSVNDSLVEDGIYNNQSDIINVDGEDVHKESEPGMMTSLYNDAKSDFAFVGEPSAEAQSEDSTPLSHRETAQVVESSTTTAPPVTKSKRKPNTKQVIQLKTERQSPTQLSSSTTSPPMTPPPANNQSGLNNLSGVSGASSPPPPIKQMEQMMSATARNYSDFMRSLAAKYNQQNSNNNEYYRTSPTTTNFTFDTRFLKPAAAAALLNLSCGGQLPSVILEKEKFPLIDMSSTQTLLSMVRSASAAAAVAANNLDYFKTNNNSNNKRPNSPLDLSARDQQGTPPAQKKSKLKHSAADLFSKGSSSSSSNCASACSSGCTDEAQTMINWSVEDVCRFVSSIDLCKDYVEAFREHSVDGSSLPLLTEEHLMTTMNMKLGPALKFRSTVARKLGNCLLCSHCIHCHNHSNNASSINS